MMLFIFCTHVLNLTLTLQGNVAHGATCSQNECSIIFQNPDCNLSVLSGGTFETGQSSNAPSPDGSNYLTSSSDAASNLDSTVFEEKEENECELESYALHHSREAKAFERLYNECKRETNEVLAKHKNDIERMKRLRDE
ncbi:hypothetical protein REPUB_Repub12eG0180800 [Reevesia pubescens]